MGKEWFKSKTVWVGVIEVAIGLLGLVGEFLQIGDFGPVAITALAAGVLTIVLRKLTSEPII